VRNIIPLTAPEISDCQTAWFVISRGACILDVSEATRPNSDTRFEPLHNRVFLGADVMPGQSSYRTLDELSYTAVLAHEFTHFVRHGATLSNYVLEEVATHVQAAETPTLGLDDRCGLIRCAEEILMDYRMKECS